MNNVTQIINALKPIAQKLGEGGQQLYKAYYRQTIINGIESIVLSLLILIGLGVLVRYTYKQKPKKFDTPDEDVMLLITVLSLVGIAIAVAVVFVGLIPGINDLVNPNYQTIQNVIRQVR